MLDFPICSQERASCAQEMVRQNHLHLGTLDHLVGNVHVLGVVLVVMDLLSPPQGGGQTQVQRPGECHSHA